MSGAFDYWHRGRPVLALVDTGDFASWRQGAPVLQLVVAAVAVVVEAPPAWQKAIPPTTAYTKATSPTTSYAKGGTRTDWRKVS
jgi:hypothetical protein